MKEEKKSPCKNKSWLKGRRPGNRQILQGQRGAPETCYIKNACSQMTWKGARAARWESLLITNFESIVMNYKTILQYIDK